MRRTLLCLLGLLSLLPIAGAQSCYSNVAQSIGQGVLVPIPFATIRICTPGSTQSACGLIGGLTSTTLYTTPQLSGGPTQANPITADAGGNFYFCASISQHFAMVVSGQQGSYFTPDFNTADAYPMSVVNTPPMAALQNILGPITANSVNGVLFAPNFGTGDMAQHINAAFATCPSGAHCTVTVPPGNWSISNTIGPPLGGLDRSELYCDSGSAFTYTGTSVAVEPVGPSLTSANFKLTNCQFYGNTSSIGLLLNPLNNANITRSTFYGFQYGIELLGANTVNIDHDNIRNNTVGIFGQSAWCNGEICSATYNASYASYTVNAIHIDHNVIAGNTQWGILFDGTQPGNTGPRSVTISQNDIESNGSAGAAYGGINVLRGVGWHISDNYLENEPRQIVLGTPSAGACCYFWTQGFTVSGNYFTDSIGDPKYQIELISASYTHITDNATVNASMDATSCFLNIVNSNHTNFDQATNQIQIGGGGNVLCSNGSLVYTLVETGDAVIINDYFKPRMIYQNFPITTGSTDSVPGQYVLPQDACYITAPSNASAATAAAAIPSMWLVPGTGTITFNHPSTTSSPGLLFNIWCAGPFNN